MTDDLDANYAKAARRLDEARINAAHARDGIDQNGEHAPEKDDHYLRPEADAEPEHEKR